MAANTGRLRSAPGRGGSSSAAEALVAMVNVDVAVAEVLLSVSVPEEKVQARCAGSVPHASVSVPA